MMGQIKAIIEKAVDQYVEDNIERLSEEGGCNYPDCRRDGDWVDYGSTQVMLPPIICDHMWERAWNDVMERYERGELVIVDGKLVEEGSAQ